MSESEWVYVMENEGLPGMVKIGWTRRCPGKRLRKINSGINTFVGSKKFSLRWSRETKSGKPVEHNTHWLLRDFRIPGTREIFNVSAEHAIYAIAAVDYGIAPIEAWMRKNYALLKKLDDDFRCSNKEDPIWEKVRKEWLVDMPGKFNWSIPSNSETCAAWREVITYNAKSFVRNGSRLVYIDFSQT